MIRFRREHMPDVLSGCKTATLRFQRPRVRPGERTVLAFGRRDRPTLVPATITAVQEYDLTADLMYASRVFEAEDPEAELQQVIAELEELASGEEDGEDGDEGEDTLMAACEASGTDYWDLLAEALERRATRVWAVWFRVVDGSGWGGLTRVVR